MSGALTTEQQLNMSLDEVKESRRQRGRRAGAPGRHGRGGYPRSRGAGMPRGSVGGRGGTFRAMGMHGSQGRPANQTKLSVTNMPYNVTEANLLELFSAIGRVTRVQLNYDRHGASTGTATVVYDRFSDAKKAIDQYHNVLIDARPLKVEMVLAPDKLELLPSEWAKKDKVSYMATRSANGNVSGQRGRRRGRGGGRSSVPRKTADQLNQEMTAYMELDDDGNRRQNAVL